MMGAECEQDYLLISLQMKVWKHKWRLRFSGCMHGTLNPLRARTHPPQSSFSRLNYEVIFYS